MSKHDQMILSVPVEGNKDANVIEVTAKYEKGGRNFATGGDTERGIYYSAHPYLIENKDGYVTRRYVGWSGVRMFKQSLSRFSRKQLEQHSNMPDWLGVERVLNHVVNSLGGMLVRCFYLHDKEIEGDVESLIDAHGGKPGFRITYMMRVN